MKIGLAELHLEMFNVGNDKRFPLLVNPIIEQALRDGKLLNDQLMKKIVSSTNTFIEKNYSTLETETNKVTEEELFEMHIEPSKMQKDFWSLKDSDSDSN